MRLAIFTFQFVLLCRLCFIQDKSNCSRTEQIVFRIIQGWQGYIVNLKRVCTKKWKLLRILFWHWLIKPHELNIPKSVFLVEGHVSVLKCLGLLSPQCWLSCSQYARLYTKFSDIIVFLMYIKGVATKKMAFHIFYLGSRASGLQNSSAFPIHWGFCATAFI